MPAAVAPSTTVETAAGSIQRCQQRSHLFFDISDDSACLQRVTPLNGPNANPNYFLQLTQDSMGNGPFLPSFVVAYGTRMCYGASARCSTSAARTPHSQLTGDQNTPVRMPNHARSGHGVSALRRLTSLYITGEGYTALTLTDKQRRTGDVGAAGIRFPGLIGSPFPWQRLLQDRRELRLDGDRARALDLFNGQFQQEKPITFLISGLGRHGTAADWLESG